MIYTYAKSEAFLLVIPCRGETAAHDALKRDTGAALAFEPLAPLPNRIPERQSPIGNLLSNSYS